MKTAYVVNRYYAYEGMEPLKVYVNRERADRVVARLNRNLPRPIIDGYYVAALRLKG